jgi:amidohydrolase
MDLKSLIAERSHQQAAELREIREHLHAHPELSYKEKETAAYISSKLSAWGIEHSTGIAGHGMVAWVKGRHPESRTRAMRADMDALPIHERNEVPYRSQHPGVMHACGHDVHSTCVLGAARILHELREHWEGTVQVIFQPAEEVLPGGASLMIKEGVFANSRTECIFGQHVYPELPVGKVGFRPGMYMASTDELYVTVKGKGGHGAKPDRAIDPVLIAAHLVVALQQVASRWANPQIPTVLSFGKVIANGATNILPDEVRMEGTFRTFDEAWRHEAHVRMKQLAEDLCKAMGGAVDFRIERGYPVVHNHEELTHAAMQVARDYLGVENVVLLDMRTTAEDFAYYSQIMPGCFYRLGTSGTDGTFNAPIHNAHFDVHEKAIETGAGLMAYIAATAHV